MTPEVALHAAQSAASWPRRLVCVSLNAAIDKIASVDQLRPGEIHRPALLSVVPGGKALNVARAAATLGMPVRALAVLGGQAGDWMEAALRARAIDARAVRIDGETRTCLSVLDERTGRLTEFYEPGLRLEANGWAKVREALATELADDAAGSLAVLAGSLPPGAPVNAYASLTVEAARLGARTVVDADRSALDEALPARPWLVKVNAREAAAAAGTAGADEVDVLAAARALRARTAGAVLVTRGADGAVVLDEAGVAWRVGPPPERGRYPVGSGDSLLAGLLVALGSGHSLPEAARRGGAVAAANALRPGQGEFDPHDADRILPAITLDRIDR
ncbi:MAG: hexose kinase [Chloroflexi bacterium]|nr:hexose kinase [Chloroflexota bacterium]